MTVRIKTDFERNALAFVKRVEVALYAQLALAVYEVMGKAVVDARKYTRERGRPTSRDGRVHRGAMIGAINYKIAKRAKAITAEFGFTGELQAYYIYQTVTGFTHWISSEFIEPTFAIRDAFEKSKGEMTNAIEAAIRRVRV